MEWGEGGLRAGITSESRIEEDIRNANRFFVWIHSHAQIRKGPLISCCSMLLLLTLPASAPLNPARNVLLE